MGMNENRVEGIGNGSETSEYLHIFVILTYEPHCIFKKTANQKRKDPKM